MRVEQLECRYFLAVYAAYDAYQVTKNSPVSVPAPGILSNDTIDGNSTFATSVGQPSHGALSWNPDGSFTYTPESGFVGLDGFPYRASDGTQFTDFSYVTLQVLPALDSQLVLDIAPGISSSHPSGTVSIGGAAYFVASSTDVGCELWRSDGTATGTSLVKDIWPGSNSSIQLGQYTGSSFSVPLVVFNENVFFYANDGVHGFELWKSDGTAEGTAMVKDINPGEDSSGSADSEGGMPLLSYAIANGALYFSANDGQHGFELWKTDGTEAGTTLVKDVNDIYLPMSGGDWRPLSAIPTNFVAAGNTVYFTARIGSNVYDSQNSLWKTDGTAAGTVKVKDGPFSDLTDFCPASVESGVFRCGR